MDYLLEYEEFIAESDKIDNFKKRFQIGAKKTGRALKQVGKGTIDLSIALLPLGIELGLNGLDYYLDNKAKQKAKEYKDRYFKNLDYQEIENIFNEDKKYQMLYKQLQQNREWQKAFSKPVTSTTQRNAQIANIEPLQGQELKILRDIQKREKEILPSDLYNALTRFRADLKAQAAGK